MDDNPFETTIEREMRLSMVAEECGFMHPSTVVDKILRDMLVNELPDSSTENGKKK